MDGLVWIVVGLNAAANASGTLLQPLRGLSGWLFATLVAVVSGVAMLVVFKYVSNQSAIARVRRLRPGSVETDEQIEAVEQFAREWREQGNVTASDEVEE